MKIQYNRFKAISFLLALVVSLLVVPQVLRAQTTSPTPTQATGEKTATGSASASDSADLKKLRDKLASAVAQLRKKDEQVIAGEITKIDGQTMEIYTQSEATQKIQMDEVLTKYYRIVGAAKEDIQLKDMKVGQYVIITGLRTEGLVSANEIFVDEPFESKAGRIVEINSATFTFKLETYDKESLTINVERSVTQEYMNPTTLGVGAGGFSLMKEGDVAHVVYRVPSLKSQATSITPMRILIIPQGYFAK